ncbi:MAG: dephospho-CoA kinase [Clostridia bacterium]|nr:dephospho-CoA kinase [Clostridia bacterium]
MKLTVGVTGLSGAGKSTVSDFLCKNGFHLIDADKIARDVLCYGSEGYFRVLEEFGNEYINHDKTINRKKLGATVFSDKNKLEKLNAITLPLIIKTMLEEVDSSCSEYILMDAPLLLDCELKDICDEIIYVYAEREKIIERIIKRDGISRKVAEDRINSQRDDEYFRKYATIIIENNNGKNDLIEKAGKLLCQLKNRNC